jgi:citrate lyase subunit beta/citryl-CoA lyase
MPSVATPRSYLFVPGNRPDRFAKACAAGADAVIVDLEDAVAPVDKLAARTAVAAWLAPAQRVLLRINDGNSEWFRDDLKLCSNAGVAGVVLPKAERMDHVHCVAEHLGSSKPIFLQIETARGFWNALELGKFELVERLLFGSLDFQLDLGIHADSGSDEGELLYFRSQLVLISRMAGIQSPVDGVTTIINDVGRIHADTLRAKRLGFGGKLCIHPKQVPIVNEAFAPTAEEEGWARGVMEVAAKSQGAATSVNGKMIDRPVLARAEAILASIAQVRRR